MKDDLIKVLQKNFDISKNTAKILIDVVIDEMINQLKKNKYLCIPKLGTLSIYNRKKRIIMDNIQKKKHIIHNYKRIKFNASKNIKKWLKSKK